MALTLAASGEGPGASPERRWIVGDLHVHVSPPDRAGHSELTVAKAIAAARRVHLDFIALTPHRAHALVASAPGEPAETGQQVVTRLAETSVQKPSALGPEGHVENEGASPLVVAGWEYTREDPGHLGILFADVAALRALDPDEVAPSALRAGALVTVNHPFFGPVRSDHPLLQKIRTDRTWRPFAGTGTGETAAFNAIEVWHERSALVERMHRARAEELPATQMLRRSLAAWDRVTLAQRRRVVGVGGSDAHGVLPYTPFPLPAVSVLVDARDEDGLRAGLLAGRVTFGLRGGVDARSFAATSDVEGASATIGGSLRARREVRLAWEGRARLIENGVDVGEFEGGAVRAVDPPGAFAFWRIEKPGEQFSNMIYANLP